MDLRSKLQLFADTFLKIIDTQHIVCVNDFEKHTCNWKHNGHVSSQNKKIQLT